MSNWLPVASNELALSAFNGAENRLAMVIRLARKPYARCFFMICESPRTTSTVYICRL